MRTGNNTLDLSNTPNDVYLNGTGGSGGAGGGASTADSAGGIIDGVTSVIGLVRSKKAAKAEAKDTAAALSLINRKAQLAANQSAEAKQRLEEAKAKFEAARAGKIMGMKKPVFYSIVGFTVLLLAVGGIVIYKRMSK